MQRSSLKSKFTIEFSTISVVNTYLNCNSLCIARHTTNIILDKCTIAYLYLLKQKSIESKFYPNPKLFLTHPHFKQCCPSMQPATTKFHKQKVSEKAPSLYGFFSHFCPCNSSFDARKVPWSKVTFDTKNCTVTINCHKKNSLCSEVNRRLKRKKLMFSNIHHLYVAQSCSCAFLVT